MSIVREGPTSEPDIESASRGKPPGGQSEDKAAFTEDGTWTGSWDFEWAKSLDAINEWVAWEWIAGVLFVITLVASYFLNRDLFGSVDVFRTTTDYDTEAALETSETGLGGSIGFPVAEDARLNIFVRLSENELINDAYTPQFGAYLKPFTELKAQLGYTYTIDKRDDVIDPTEGWDFIFSQNIATPLGDVTYIRSTIVADYYKPFFEEWVFHAKLSGGIIGDYEKEGISYNDNFFVGGSIIRGFKRSGVGPRDLQTDYVLGAKQYLVGTLEAKVPLGIPKDFGIKTYIFTDFGVIGKTDVEATNVQDYSAFRASYGLAFNWK